MANNMVYTQGTYEGNPVILIHFEYDSMLVEEVKKIPGRKWNPSFKCWYIPDTLDNRLQFGLPDYVGIPSKREPSKVGEINKAALDELREMLVLKGYSKNTQRTYCFEFAQFLYILGNHDAKSLDEDRIRSTFFTAQKSCK